MNDLVSVIVPVYNASNTIKRCVDSLINSSYKDLEIILIDDCSKDNSYDLCLEYANQYDYIYAFKNEKNSGVSHTRNVGLENAHGKYIAFIDSDDWIEPNHIEHLVKLTRQHNDQSLVVTGYINDDRLFNGHLTYIKYDESTIHHINDVLETLFDKTLIQQLWNKLFIRDIIEKHHIRFHEDLRIGEDTRLILEYLKYSNIKNIYTSDMCNIHYMRDQKDSLMQHSEQEKIENLIENIELLYELIDVENKEELIRKRVQQLIRTNAYLIISSADLSNKEKKEFIYKLDANNGKALYKEFKKIYMKERLARLLKR